MSAHPPDGLARLTEREKHTLRLIVRGHDAKSIARELDLSVHTVNERLREARRKLAVSSSREAARLLLAREGIAPEKLVPTRIGEAGELAAVSPRNGAGRNHRLALIIGGIVMTFILGLLALAAQPQVATAPPASAETIDPAVEATARRFLTLIDQEKWAESYRLTGTAFQQINTEKVWADVSAKVRPPLGAMLSRTLLSQENLPAPPRGYEVVKFRTSFANKREAVETVTLDREGGGWRVVGVTVG